MNWQLLTVIAVVLLVFGPLAVTYLIRGAGRQQQAAYDQDVSQFIAGTQPDPAFQQQQAQIEQNLADADALEARLDTPAPPTTAPIATAPAEPPDPTL